MRLEEKVDPSCERRGRGGESGGMVITLNIRIGGVMGQCPLLALYQPPVCGFASFSVGLSGRVALACECLCEPV